MMKTSLENLTVDTFQPRVGHTFRIQVSAEQTIEADLIEARALGDPGRTPAVSARRRAFGLSFRTTLGSVLPQRIYSVTHDEIGTLDIFLVPVGPDSAGMVYEAIFT
jgi:hypothetical protein